MKLNLLYDNLSKPLKEFINKHLPSGHQNFRSLLQKCKDNISYFKQDQKQDLNITLNWQGTRSEVELPLYKDNKYKKSIVPEIINQRFMWVDDYFHYDDWKQKLQ